LTYLTSALLQ
jgi:hypothetical protein